MSIVTRFAPSPTGFLHIGGARTALFNWLFARHHGGQFRIRIEDTDRARSTQQAVDAIFEGLTWLGIAWDGDAVFQFSRADRHAAVARQLIDEGKAYYCYCTPEELTALREQQRAAGEPTRYDGRWRDRPASEAPAGVKPAVRLKVPCEGEMVLSDSVQGDVRVTNAQLDDMVLLRADGTPTYMLSVVVDDHDMGVTHVIRGDDHLTNAFRQAQLYAACGWDLPIFAHIPLIHGPDGSKLSKRHGALGVEAYCAMGFLPEAMRNYLLRLGWGHGDDEIISDQQAVEWFDIAHVGRAPSRFDVAKLTHLNGVYLRAASDDRLCQLIIPTLEQHLESQLTEEKKSLLIKAMPGLKERAKAVTELATLALFYVYNRPIPFDQKSLQCLEDQLSKDVLSEIIVRLQGVTSFSRQNLEQMIRSYSDEKALKLGKVAQPLRAALAGTMVSPPIFEVMELLGKEESLGRLQDAVCRTVI